MVSVAQTLAAADITTSAETLQLLSAREDITVKANLAVNPATPADTLRKLADCDNTFILTQLATNPTAPPDMLNKLAESTNFLIIENVIKNPNVTTQTFSEHPARGSAVKTLVKPGRHQKEPASAAQHPAK